VEQPALALLAELGWQTAGGLEETFAPGGGSLGRRNRSEVVLLPRLRAALERLNPGQPPEAISAAIKEISRNRSAMGLVAVSPTSNRPTPSATAASTRLLASPHRRSSQSTRVRPAETSSPLVKGK
jgi:type I restriction enzyme R subunit